MDGTTVARVEIPRAGSGGQKTCCTPTVEEYIREQSGMTKLERRKLEVVLNLAASNKPRFFAANNAQWWYPADRSGRHSDPHQPGRHREARSPRSRRLAERGNDPHPSEAVTCRTIFRSQDNSGRYLRSFPTCRRRARFLALPGWLWRFLQVGSFTNPRCARARGLYRHSSFEVGLRTPCWFLLRRTTISAPSDTVCGSRLQPMSGSECTCPQHGRHSHP